MSENSEKCFKKCLACKLDVYIESDINGPDITGPDKNATNPNTTRHPNGENRTTRPRPDSELPNTTPTRIFINLLNMESSTLEKLIKECHSAKTKAYAPYSRFRVGAAILCQDGKIFQGCNVENASHGQGICAERAAIVTAVSHGYRRFKAIAVTTDIVDKLSYPCGACRQYIIEFGVDYDVYLVKPDSTYKKIKVIDLLPLAFGPAHLNLLSGQQWSSKETKLFWHVLNRGPKL